ncbi:MAG TPA: hypothetical protein VMT86_18360 [Bryobacteraceae bacterium]|nr:hypothetical protein [Bryobacteraceae bacterium]
MSALIWFLHPLVCYVLLALGMGLNAYLFVTLKSELRSLARSRSEERRQLAALEAALADTRHAIQDSQADLREVEQQTGMLVAPAAARSGLNLSKRTQVLRLHRAGHDIAGIATTLSLPRAEVDLLVKVHRIVVEQI